jgi:pimeloyl-ACP methyl ester carboxylesterase
VEAEAEVNHDFASEQLAEIKVPTLVIGGEEDKFYLNRETAEGIPNARLILYEGFGHNAFDDNKRQFQADILAFLKEDA